MSYLAEHLLDALEHDDDGELKAVVDIAEELLDVGTVPDAELVTVGLVESLHHGVSHRSELLETSLEGMLPARCRSAWNECRDLHLRVAT